MLNLLEVTSKSQYHQMLQPLVTVGVIKQQEMEDTVRSLRQLLRRNDRIVWWIKWYRLATLWEFSNRPLQSSFQQANIDELYNKILKSFNLSDAVVETYVSQFLSTFALNSHELAHNISFFDDIPELNNLVWDGKPSMLAAKMTLIITEWSESRNKQIDMGNYPNQWEKIIDYGNTAWVLIDAPNCRKEGNAMGHCGNTASYRADDRILSFRTIHKKRPIHTPHLTFILKAGGILGEMKGRGNTKPEPKYHRVIMELLLHDIVNGIDGGGYAPQSNFDLMDLDNQYRNILLQKKPILFDAKDHIQMGVPVAEALTKYRTTRLFDHLEEIGIGDASEYEVHNGEIKVEDYNDIGDVGKYFAKHYGFSTMQYLCEVIEDGYVDLEHYEDQGEYKNILDNAKSDDIDIILKILNGMFDDEMIGQSDIYRILHEYRHDNFEEIDEIHDALSTAARDGSESGTYGEMYAFLEDVLNENNIRRDRDGQYQWYLDSDQIEGISSTIGEHFEKAELAEYLEIADGIDPYYGWYDFDLSVAVESFSDQLYKVNAYRKIYDHREELNRLKKLAGTTTIK